LSEENQKNFEELAIDIFVRSPPFDPPIPSEISCPRCDADVPKTASQCQECGEKIPVCLITSHAITSDPGHSWCCSTCNHYVRLDLVDTLNLCPLCHHPINDDDYEVHH
jgi:DNA-directed RNA polymerase subunit RPC12/RpoP